MNMVQKTNPIGYLIKLSLSLSLCGISRMLELNQGNTIMKMHLKVQVCPNVTSDSFYRQLFPKDKIDIREGE